MTGEQSDPSFTHRVEEKSSAADLGIVYSWEDTEGHMPVPTHRSSHGRRVVFVILVAIGLGLAVWVTLRTMTGGGGKAHESMEGIRLPLERMRESSVSAVPRGKRADDRDTRVFEVKVREIEAGGGQPSAREVVVVEHPATAEPRDSAERYSVNAASCRKRAHAESLAEKLKKKGYAPSVVEVTLPGKGRWYRVSLGQFSSEEEALSLARVFQEREGKECFITTTK